MPILPVPAGVDVADLVQQLWSRVADLDRLTPAVVVRGPFPIAFDTPNLETGVELFTPTPGDLLLTGSTAIVTEGFGPPAGAYGWSFGAWTTTGSNPTGTYWANYWSGLDLDTAANADYAYPSGGAGSYYPSGIYYPQIIARFESSAPFCARLETGGNTPDQGAADLYVVTATPTP